MMCGKGKSTMQDTRGTARKVVVTGAGRGMGRETTISLIVEHGCTVFALSRSEDALRSLAEACAKGPGKLHPLHMDITQDNASTRLLGRFEGLRLHGLVHNAGSLMKGEMGQYEGSEVGDLFRTNVVVPLLLSQALAPMLAGDPPGHILHIGSMGGFQDSVKFPGLVAYSSSKAALACMSQCLAEEFKDQGIRSNCLAMGAVDTEMLRAAFPGYQAPTSAQAMGSYVARFLLEGHFLYNGKVLPVAVSTP